MVANKHISKIIIAVMAVAVALCFLAVIFSGELTKLLGGTGVKMEYESKLFDTDEIISVNIKMDEDEWNKMLSNAQSEEYYVCDVVINGKEVQNVAIRPKGNTSLSAIAMDPNTDRYSLKLEFDHFVDGQTCWGLDKLILNNNYADATNMKEAVIYDMYRFIGAESSLYNYAKVSVNGEYWGVYLALEGVEESFMLRNFGTQDGELYKPDSMEMGGGDKSSDDSKSDKGSSGFGGMTPPDNKGGFSFDSGKMPDRDSFDSGSMPDMGSFDPNNMPDRGSFDSGSMPDMGSFDPNNKPDGGDFGFDGGSMPDMGDFSPSDRGGSSKGGSSKGGADLNYTDDELDSYSTIWEGEITSTGKSDRRKVVTALKNISEGTDLEKYLDVDNVLKYMAVHTFAVNMDSLSGSMAHNYYLYEYDGQLNIFPWDYNLSLGGMSMGASSGTDVVNDAIDTPFSGTEFFDALLENEEYLERYHEYLRQLVDEYVNGGRFDEFYNRTRDQIDSLVETDPTAFYSYDEYLNAADILYDTVKLRAQSVEGQLDGTIPSTDAGQRQDSSALIDGSEIDIAAMGQFDMGGSGGFGGFGFGGRSDSKSDDGAPEEKTSEPSSESATESADIQSVTPQNKAYGSDSIQTVSVTASNASGGFSPNNMPNGGSMPDMGNFDLNNMPDMGNFDPNNMPDMGNFDPNNMPDMGNFDPNNMPDRGNFEPIENDDSEGSPFGGDDKGSEKATEDSASAPDSKRPSFSGMPGQSGSAEANNLVLYGVCLAVMLAALFGVMLIKRKQ